MAISLIGYDRVTRARKGCNRCGSNGVAWRESKDGKWYLIEAFDFGDPETGADWRGNFKDFHSGYCNKPELHRIKQRQIEEALGMVEREEIELDVVVEEHRAAEEAEYFLKLHDLCKNDPAMADREMTRRVVACGGVTDSASRKRLLAEIEFMRAALGSE